MKLEDQAGNELFTAALMIQRDQKPSFERALELLSREEGSEAEAMQRWARAMLTTLTREFFMPRFLERDEGERAEPIELYPWDGVRDLRPFSRLADSSAGAGVY